MVKVPDAGKKVPGKSPGFAECDITGSPSRGSFHSVESRSKMAEVPS